MSYTVARRYEEIISQYDYDQLQALWQAIVSGETPEWSQGKAFEYFVLRAFQLEGAEVRWPYSVYDEGVEIEQIDGAIYWDGLACIVECKDQRDLVNIDAIAKLRNQLLRRPGPTVGVLFSRSGFTLPAIKLAQYVAPQTILLWQGDQIDYALSQQVMCRSLVAKYRHCVEHGDSNYNIIMGGLP